MDETSIHFGCDIYRGPERGHAGKYPHAPRRPTIFLTARRTFPPAADRPAGRIRPVAEITRGNTLISESESRRARPLAAFRLRKDAIQ